MTDARQSKARATPPVVTPDTVSDYKDDALLTRLDAAKLLSRCWGGINVSPRSVASWPITYKKLGHHSLYRRGDVVAFASRKLQNTPIRTGAGIAGVRRKREPPQMIDTLPGMEAGQRHLGEPGRVGAHIRQTATNSDVVASETG